MGAPLVNIVTPTMLEECWCPIHTPFWLPEVAKLTSVNAIAELERLDIPVLSSNADDPSARSDSLSFWTAFRLKAYEDIGPLIFERMVEDDTLLLWEDYVEACQVEHFGGTMSVGAAVTITVSLSPGPRLISEKDWDLLCKPLLSSALWAARCLARHRMLCTRTEVHGAPATGL